MMTLIRKKPSIRLKTLHLKIRCSAPPLLTSISANAAAQVLQINPIRPNNALGAYFRPSFPYSSSK